MFKTTCFDVWRNEEETQKIITLCKDLDAQLAGGIIIGLITELCGLGDAKTQMCMQLSINVQFPKEIGGIGGNALYIDTNQMFAPQRLREIARAMSERFYSTFKKVNPTISCKGLFDTDTLLGNVSYIYCADYIDLIATIKTLKNILTQKPNLKLIVIDSFSFPLRSMEEVSERTCVIYELLDILQALGRDFKVAIVITNDLTTCLVETEWKISPALGELHSHKINQRILLGNDKNTKFYVALIEKSIVSPRVAIPFQIKISGMRGIS
ncbi:DNA repair protein RAD51 homolog 3-like [Teleopsis dalmanni]|uniref:DNA repair protein RAD51 homolog 3-like n=1 Tax=Teleopsis dalmanni TaxID=139649 RepID=UPI0018CCB85C|nr:DNA repair protein RAD51 homolog 3-like [Teleopsis dalmanni]XP_037952394.1 DNA repair protein RAD51 homolog 3-like [Teleopsis dalmanni]